MQQPREPHQQVQQLQEHQQQAEEEQQPEQTPSEGSRENLPPLPDGWTEHFDPASGQYYYFNAVNGTTTWERPTPEEKESEEETFAPPQSEPHSNPAESTLPPSGLDASVAEEVRVNEPSEQSEEADQVNTNQDLSDGTPKPDSSNWQTQTAGGWGMPENEAGKEPEKQQSPTGWGVPTESQMPPQQMQQSSENQSQQQPQQQQAQQQPPETQGWGLSLKESNEAPENITPPRRPAWGAPPQNQGSQMKSGENPYQQGPPGQQQQEQQQQQQQPGQNAPPIPGQNQPPPQYMQGRSPPGQIPPQQQRQQPPPPSQQQVGQQQYPYPPGQQNPYYGQYGQYSQYGQPGGPPGMPGQPRPPNSGQLVQQQESPVKEALGGAWRNILGFGEKARETAAQARDTVARQAAEATQTLTTTSSSK